MEMKTAFVQLLFLTTLAMCVPQNAIKILEDTVTYDEYGQVYSYHIEVTHDEGVDNLYVCNGRIYVNEERAKK